MRAEKAELSLQDVSCPAGHCRLAVAVTWQWQAAACPLVWDVGLVPFPAGFSSPCGIGSGSLRAKPSWEQKGSYEVTETQLVLKQGAWHIRRDAHRLVHRFV